MEHPIQLTHLALPLDKAHVVAQLEAKTDPHVAKIRQMLQRPCQAHKSQRLCSAQSSSLDFQKP